MKKELKKQIDLAGWWLGAICAVVSMGFVFSVATLSTVILLINKPVIFELIALTGLYYLFSIICYPHWYHLAKKLSNKK